MPRITTTKLNTYVRGEYKKRFFSTLFIGITIVLCVHMALVLSSYMLLSSYEETHKSNNDHVQIELTKKREYFTSIINETSALSTSVIDTQSNLHISIFESIKEHATNSIQLNVFEVFFTEKGIEVTLRGIAETRQSLVEFAEKMRNNEAFADFEIPFETLTKQKDVPFDVTFTYHEIK